MPSGRHFFHDLFFLAKTETQEADYVNSLGLTIPGINDLIVRAWGMKRNRKHFATAEWNRVNIEDVFTFLHIGERMHPRGTHYQRGFAIARRELQEFVTMMLTIKSEGMHCEHLMNILGALHPEDSIFSFNWDTIADFTLQRLQSRQYAAYLDLMSAPSLRPTAFTHRGVLLKLHGSLNWLVCQEPQCSLHNTVRLAQRDKALLRFSDMRKCPACGNESGQPFIVPPTSQKFISRGTFLHKLWLIAREQLQYCGRLLFVGYSFPVTDFYSDWLFRQIHFLESHRPDIIVVDPEMMKKRSQLKDRYRSIFRGCKINGFPSLEVFCKEGLDQLRAPKTEPTTACNTTARKPRRG
jgi:hypothetical protein